MCVWARADNTNTSTKCFISTLNTNQVPYCLNLMTSNTAESKIIIQYFGHSLECDLISPEKYRIKLSEWKYKDWGTSLG